MRRTRDKKSVERGVRSVEKCQEFARKYQLVATSGKRKEGCLMTKKEKRKVVVEVNGGVADVTQCPDDVEVKIIDHDNDSG